jgi:peptide/nickel transport system permease protein
MLSYIGRRILYMIPTLFAISIIVFIIIQLPHGDYATYLTEQMKAQQGEVSPEFEQAMRERFGLDQPITVQYFKWITNLLRGDFGYSFEHNQPVVGLIGERLTLTFVLSVSTLMFTWIVALPVGIYSAVKQYSLGDYVFTTFGFIGLAIPNFLLALVMMYIAFEYFGASVGGLFSPEYENAPWSLAKVWDLIMHMWIPIVIIGTAGTAGLIRTMRANLLDELNKPYVETARAKGMSELRLLLKYPVRHALNPFVSTVGWTLPRLVSGAAIVSIILNLPTTGPLLLNSLLAQDMYLAASFILMLSALTVIGTLLSDLLLAWLDPRIRYEK